LPVKGRIAPRQRDKDAAQQQHLRDEPPAQELARPGCQYWQADEDRAISSASRWREATTVFPKPD